MRTEGGTKETWRRIADGELPWGALRARARVLEGIRAFFREREFLEVDPPIAQAYPNVDPNIFPVEIADANGKASRFYLHTSPEPAMKKLLAAGSGDIFFLGKAFRDREGSPLHSPEFTLLEWYRVGGDANDVMRDVEELVGTLALAIGGGTAGPGGHPKIPLEGPWPRWELDDLFREFLGAGMADEKGLREALGRRGLRPGADETWEDLFHRACLDVVEPALVERGACFLTGYPTALGAMARRRPGRPELSERFEGYLAGVELVNGYEELTDPAEQEDRLLALTGRHLRSTGVALPVDPGFLDALRLGLPRCAGAALGVDRLVMLLLGKDDIADGMYR
ncbi:MAG: EF-P lysine aminoacylase GenX [Deltaproteobacteria bacterium]|nr:EF-P lysine aminoacylase GenX [Deltaproteobacteria bacterium]